MNLSTLLFEEGTRNLPGNLTDTDNPNDVVMTKREDDMRE